MASDRVGTAETQVAKKGLQKYDSQRCFSGGSTRAQFDIRPVIEENFDEKSKEIAR